jgi:hypothetical protein
MKRKEIKDLVYSSFTADSEWGYTPYEIVKVSEEAGVYTTLEQVEEFMRGKSFATSESNYLLAYSDVVDFIAANFK